VLAELRPLSELSETIGLNQAQVDRLLRAADTIRGDIPNTFEAWRELHDLIEKHKTED